MATKQEPTERVSICLTKETAAEIRRTARAMGVKPTYFMTVVLSSGTRAMAEAFEHKVKAQVPAAFTRQQ